MRTTVALGIAKAVRRDKRSKKRKQNLARFQVRQLWRLLFHRGLIPLPDDKQGRRHLQPMLDLGLRGADVVDTIAPWITGDELREMFSTCRVGPHWNARLLGDRYEVTLEEKQNLDLRNLECFDANKGDYQSELKKRRRIKDAHRKRKKRMREQKSSEEKTNLHHSVPSGLPWNVALQAEARCERIELFYKWLASRDWLSIHDMARGSLIDAIPAYRNASLAAVEQKLRHGTALLVGKGLLESKTVKPESEGARVHRVFRARRMGQKP